MRPKLPRRKCKVCEKELDRPEKYYCNNKCQQDFQYLEYIRKWKLGEILGLNTLGIVTDPIRKYLRVRSENKCEWCGWNKKHPITGEVPLEAHHIDGISEHNTENNLAFICPNCHSLTETYRGRNRGKGRSNRASLTQR